MLRFIIPGEPHGQSRPRFTQVNGHVHTYDAEESRNYKAYVKMIAQTEAKEQGWKIADNDEGIGVNVYAYMGIPQSKGRKFRTGVHKGIVRPTKKPDVDNIFKAVTDALNGLLFKDDKQIIHARVEKWYDDEPRVEVEVFILRKELM
ncbi:MAG: RusA family crossover junction endodeoxyribonuclease [Bacteroidales bacterium]|nr:RusA family crossover junction endodeoxyribonuclease [Bacteroidales bacterium]MBQ8809542.1 RusA family crossover junction endodeoxyribonuclease [Bacteroidales bacterium]